MYSSSYFSELCKELIDKNDNVSKDQLFVDTVCVNPKSAIVWVYFQHNLSEVVINYDKI